MSSEPNGDAPPPAPAQRPRLNLKPRDPEAAKRLEQERRASAKSPFGDARPREAVIASRVGKSEEEILKEEVLKEKLHLRLSPEQLEEKRAQEAAVKEIEDQLALEEDASKQSVLSAELAARQQQLDALMGKFERLAIESAKSGEAPRVSQLRKQQQAEGGGVPGVPLVAGTPYGGTGGAAGAGGRYHGGQGGYGNQGAGHYGGGSSGGGRGFPNYVDRQPGGQQGRQQRTGLAEGYVSQQGGDGGYGGYQGGGYQRSSGGGRNQRLPEWAVDDAGSDAGFYDMPSFGGAAGAGGGGGSRGFGNRGQGQRSGRGGGRGGDYGGGSYGSGSFGSGSFGDGGLGGGFGDGGYAGERGGFSTGEIQDRF